MKEGTMKPNVLIIGGDISGKELVLIKQIPISRGYRYEYTDRDYNIKHVSQALLDAELAYLSDGGKYPIVCDETEFQKYEFDSIRRVNRLNGEIKKRVKEWIVLLNEKTKNNPNVQVYINCGNDDPLFIDKLLGKYQPEGKVIVLRDNVKLLSLGYSVKTPWKCPRDTSEEELNHKISSMTSQIKEGDILIFNFHCPPYNTFLDEVYEVDDNLQKRGNRKHVGSKYIREAIERFKPILSLHGHIHEAKYSELIGSTRCVNPGSNYQNGILQGAYFIIDNGKVEKDLIVDDLFGQKIGRPSFFAKLISFIKTLLSI
jgi:Icc-related predicted phosphoesterase